MNKKMLFTDLDGTLLNDQKQITQKNRAAINQALTAGHKIVISTGRPLQSAILLANELGLNTPGCYAVTYNGGIICDTSSGEIIYRTSVSKDNVRWLFDQAKIYGIHCQTYSSTQILAEADSEELQYYVRGTNLPCLIVENATEYLTEDPAKVLLIDIHNKENLSRFQSEQMSWEKGRVKSFFSCDQYLEYVAPHVSKGNAVRYLSDYLHIPLKDTISAGDAENDISMLKAAAVGAVMQNASDDIKKHGTYITQSDNNHDGISEIIRRFLI